jgi:precorrin-3B C17-methyltransferase
MNKSTGSKPELVVVGIGPGIASMRTHAADTAIGEADIIIGYKTYIDLVADLTSGKKIDATGMRDEVKRVNRAIDYALDGNCVALVSSGDPGVYGMAGLAFELCSSRAVTIPVQIVPGITAANSAAALLGAPLSCDYCVLSLSDLLVPEKQILQRARAAAAGDFVTVLYNPVSRKRTTLIHDIRALFFEQRSPETPVGIVRNGFREKQMVSVSTLELFISLPLDMLTTVIIGNSQSFQSNGRMVNPRGYRV